MTPIILDCTLRDGSYSINFQFSYEDTLQIVSVFDRLKIPYIEVGHGMGLGASDQTKFIAAETDERYMHATANSCKSSKWGVFCIPGIAKLENLDCPIDYAMNFIRIGTDVDNYKEARPFIEKAKKAGLFVCSNIMKSYVSSPDEFATLAYDIHKFGADLIYIVDSAGGMFPEDVVSYVKAVKEKVPSMQIGFHGHNNLQLGITNSLASIEHGVTIVDTSFQGLGRSAGNTPTELFLAVLQRRGFYNDLDIIDYLDFGEKYIQPLIQQKGYNSLDIVCGIAQFHSSYMPIIYEYSKKYRVDPRLLILELVKITRTTAPENLVNDLALKLSQEDAKGIWKPSYPNYFGSEQSNAA